MVTDHFNFSTATRMSSRSPEAQRELGRKIAEMHTPPIMNESGLEVEVEGGGYTGKYGFGVPTHCGVAELNNGWEDDWETFYRDRRLADVVRKIGDKEIESEWEIMKQR